MRYFFGNRSQQVFPQRERDAWLAVPSITTVFPFNTIAATQRFGELFFVHQVHGVAGVIVDTAMPRSFAHDSDWILTNKKGLGIGVLVADCVPLLLYDPMHHVVGAVHAGWRGATGGVIDEALTAMHAAFKTEMADLQIIIGPHAKPCCYGVDQPFYDVVMQKPFGKSALHKRDGTLFFDLYACCAEQLFMHGISDTQIVVMPSCTICDPTYCSYRRDGDAAGRTIAVIGL